MKQLITDVARTLLDPNHIRWTLADLFDFANQTTNDMVRLRPEVTSEYKTLALAPGNRQTLPADCYQLLRLDRAFPSGRAIRLVSASQLDALLPLWASSEPSDTVREYVWRDHEPEVFYVWPPAKPETKVEAVVSMYPKKVTPPADPAADPWPDLPLEPKYRGILFHGILYRALSINTDATSQARAADHYRQYMTSLGLESEGRNASDPARNTGGDAQ